MILASSQEHAAAGTRPTETERVLNAIERAIIRLGPLEARRVCRDELGEAEGDALYRQICENSMDAWSPANFSNRRKRERS